MRSVAVSMNSKTAWDQKSKRYGPEPGGGAAGPGHWTTPAGPGLVHAAVATGEGR